MECKLVETEKLQKITDAIISKEFVAKLQSAIDAIYEKRNDNTPDKEVRIMKHAQTICGKIGCGIAKILSLIIAGEEFSAKCMMMLSAVSAHKKSDEAFVKYILTINENSAKLCEQYA